MAGDAETKFLNLFLVPKPEFGNDKNEKNKDFDCVEMKNAIQAQLRKENEGLTDEEIARRREWLEKTDVTLAKWWRTLPTPNFPASRA
jgi:hypothetical protein